MSKGKFKSKGKTVSKTKVRKPVKQLSKQVEKNHRLIDRLSVKEHPVLFRTTIASDFLKSYKDGVYNLENIYAKELIEGVKIKGKSFTSDPEIANEFELYKLKAIAERIDGGEVPDVKNWDDEGFDALYKDFVIIVKIRENALVEDRVISMQKIKREDLLVNKELVDQLFNPSGWDEAGNRSTIEEEIYTFNEATFKGADLKDIKEAKEFVDNWKEEWKGLEDEEHEDYFEIEGWYVDHLKDLSESEVPFLLRVDSALSVRSREEEFVTIDPSKISYDDFKIVVTQPEHKELLLKADPTLKAHIRVFSFRELKERVGRDF